MLLNMLNDLAEATKASDGKKNNLATGQMTFTPPPMPFLDQLALETTLRRLARSVNPMSWWHAQIKKWTFDASDSNWHERKRCALSGVAIFLNKASVSTVVYLLSSFNKFTPERGAALYFNLWRFSNSVLRPETFDPKLDHSATALSMNPSVGPFLPAGWSIQLWVLVITFSQGHFSFHTNIASVDQNTCIVCSTLDFYC